jgi:alpha-D-ribose 1-methylphosphonate 5-phosphate C-P lyase
MPDTTIQDAIPQDGAYNYAYLDEQTKRMIRRAILKAVAVPGYQVPFGGREMPLPYGWGTGGIQVTAAIIGREDTTTHTEEATIIQTRHRVPETPLTDGQILVFQVPIPEPLRMLEPRETETRTLHALSEYGVMQVSLYESIARHGRIAKTYNYPVMVNRRYIMSPSPIPKFDNPKLDRSPALQLYGAGREKRIYAVPPHTPVKSLDFDDHPFEVETWTESCALCGSTESFLDEMIVDDTGKRLFVCSDTDYCESRR